MEWVETSRTCATRMATNAVLCYKEQKRWPLMQCCATRKKRDGHFNAVVCYKEEKRWPLMQCCATRKKRGHGYKEEKRWPLMQCCATRKKRDGH